ncbi:MAG TPA: glycosyltransferase [Chthonomonadaceae bacterium]|nr:glycosyltransferase [Chthonomonadaceae bacterium]
MRIAIFSECYTPVTNGVVTSIQTLRETLRAQGHTVFVFAPGTAQPEDDETIFRLPELPFPKHPYHFARPFPRLKVDFPALDIQIIHCQHPFTVGRLGAEMARKHGLPMVYTAHSLYDMMAATAKSPLMRSAGQKMARGVVRRFCNRADCIIAPSRHTRDALRAAGVRGRFAVVPSGVLGPYIRPGARAQRRAELGLAPETPLILCVGRLGPEKRVDILLRAVALLAHSRRLPAPANTFRLAVVGDGQCRAPLEALAASLDLGDRVLFAGAQPHATIGDWYAAADIFALPSPAETQGLVLVEAMAAGLPCIAADYGGPRELVEQGETGLRVPLDVNAFAHALDLLLRDPQMRRHFGEQGRLRARAFSPEAMTRGMLDVYESVLRLPHLPATSRLAGILR